MSSLEKVRTLDDLVSLRQDLKRKGQRVVCTNGCFDLLHSGHRYMLVEARKLGDHLIVAVNSDDSVRRLKGPGRPVDPLPKRLQNLAEMDAVDSLVVFEEDTPCNLLRRLLPDLLVKGGDYRKQDIVGREIVESAGGTVTTVPYVEGHSTSALLDASRTGKNRENRPHHLR